MIPRYTRPQMAQIWAPERRFRIWFEIEAHAAAAMAELGLVHAVFTSHRASQHELRHCQPWARQLSPATAAIRSY
jgi:adenylosuccinate lyase